MNVSWVQHGQIKATGFLFFSSAKCSVFIHLFSSTGSDMALKLHYKMLTAENKLRLD